MNTKIKFTLFRRSKARKCLMPTRLINSILFWFSTISEYRFQRFTDIFSTLIDKNSVLVDYWIISPD